MVVQILLHIITILIQLLMIVLVFNLYLDVQILRSLIITHWQIQMMDHALNTYMVVQTLWLSIIICVNTDDGSYYTCTINIIGNYNLPSNIQNCNGFIYLTPLSGTTFHIYME